MSDMSVFLDMIIIGGGVYMLYGALALRKGEIVANILLPRNVSADRLKDKEGFIKAIFMKLLVLSIVTVLAGAAILINDMVDGFVWINVVAYVAFFAAIVVYGVAIKKAHKEFL